MNSIQLGAQRIRFDYRHGPGTPLLLCNGLGANLEVLDPLVDALGERAVLRFDAPGIGGSEASNLPLRMPQQAALLAALCRQLHIPVLDVAGLSLGGMLAQQFAHQYPEQVRSLVLMSTSPGHLMVPPPLRTLRAFADRRLLTNALAPARYLQRDFICRVAPGLYGGERLRRNPMAILPLLRRQQQLGARALAWQVAGAIGWSSLPWLHRLRQPTLVLAGRDDRAVHPLNARILARLIPDAQLELLDGAGHLFPVLDAPADTAARITRFLDGHGNVISLSTRRKTPARRAG